MHAIQLAVRHTAGVDDRAQRGPDRREVQADHPAVGDVVVRLGDIRSASHAIQVEADAVECAVVHSVEAHRDRAGDIAVEDQAEAIAVEAVRHRVVGQVHRPEICAERTDIKAVLPAVVDRGEAAHLEIGDSRHIQQGDVNAVADEAVAVAVGGGQALSVHDHPVVDEHVAEIDVDAVQEVVVSVDVGQNDRIGRATRQHHSCAVTERAETGPDIREGDIAQNTITRDRDAVPGTGRYVRVGDRDVRAAEDIRERDVQACAAAAGDVRVGDAQGNSAGVQADVDARDRTVRDDRVVDHQVTKVGAAAERGRDAIVEVVDRVVCQSHGSATGDIRSGDRNAVVSGRSSDLADVQIVDQNSVRGGDGHEGAKRNINRDGEANCRIGVHERNDPQRVESHRRNERAECHIRQRDVHALVAVVGHGGLASHAENFDCGGRRDVGQFDVNAISGVVADRVVTRDADARRVGVADPDVDTIAEVAVNRVCRPVTSQTDDGRADVVDVHLHAISRHAIERSGESHNRQIHTGVVHAVRAERIAGDGVGSGRQQNGTRACTGRIQPHAEATVVRGGNGVQPRGQHRTTGRFKVEAVAGIAVGGGVVEQHQCLTAESIRPHEDTVEVGEASTAVEVEVRRSGPQIQSAPGVRSGDQSALIVQVRRTVLEVNTGHRIGTGREEPQTGPRSEVEVGILDAGVQDASRIDDRVQTVTHDVLSRREEIGILKLQSQQAGVADQGVQARGSRAIANRVGQGDRRHARIIDEQIHRVDTGVVEGCPRQRDGRHTRIDQHIHGIDARVIEGRSRGGRIHDGANVTRNHRQPEGSGTTEHRVIDVRDAGDIEVDRAT